MILKISHHLYTLSSSHNRECAILSYVLFPSELLFHLICICPACHLDNSTHPVSLHSTLTFIQSHLSIAYSFRDVYLFLFYDVSLTTGWLSPILLHVLTRLIVNISNKSPVTDIHSDSPTDRFSKIVCSDWGGSQMVKSNNAWCHWLMKGGGSGGVVTPYWTCIISRSKSCWHDGGQQEDLPVRRKADQHGGEDQRAGRPGFSHSNNLFKVKKGNRIAQLICELCLFPDIEIVQTTSETERPTNGYGSSGIWTTFVVYNV